MTIVTKQTYNKIGFLLVWLTMFMGFPFSIAQAFNLPAKFIMGFCVLILFGIILFKVKATKFNPIIVVVFLLQISTAIVFFLLHKDGAYINLLFQIFVPFILYVYVNSFLKFEILSSSIIKLMLVMGIFSIITFVFCLVFNMSYYSIFENPDGRPGFNFIICFTNAYTDFGFAKFIRPAGFFDEPGTLAYYLLFAILINDLTIKNKRYRSILICSGIFTSSIAFYIIMLVYALFYIKKDKFVKFGLYFSVLTMFLVFSFQFLGSTEQDIIYGSTLGRLESIISPNASSDNFQADNRSDLISVAKEGIYDSPLIGQGISYASIKGSKFYGSFMGANILGIFGIHGIIGGLIFSLHVFYYIFTCFKKKNWLTVPQKSCLLFLILLLQRPDYIGGVIPYISILILIILSLNYEKIPEDIRCYGSI